MFQIIGAMAEFERALIQERVRAGLRNARAKGRRLGRPRVIESHGWAMQTETPMKVDPNRFVLCQCKKFKPRREDFSRAVARILEKLPKTRWFQFASASELNVSNRVVFIFGNVRLTRS